MNTTTEPKWYWPIVRHVDDGEIFYAVHCCVLGAVYGPFCYTRRRAVWNWIRINVFKLQPFERPMPAKRLLRPELATQAFQAFVSRLYGSAKAPMTVDDAKLCASFDTMIDEHLDLGISESEVVNAVVSAMMDFINKSFAVFTIGGPADEVLKSDPGARLQALAEGVTRVYFSDGSKAEILLGEFADKIAKGMLRDDDYRILKRRAEGIPSKTGFRNFSGVCFGRGVPLAVGLILTEKEKPVWTAVASLPVGYDDIGDGIRGAAGGHLSEAPCTSSQYVRAAASTLTCPHDTDGDGNCGRRLCPHCGQIPG